MITLFHKLLYLFMGYKVVTITDTKHNCEILNNAITLEGVHPEIRVVTGVEYEGIDYTEEYYSFVPTCFLTFIERKIGVIDDGIMIATKKMPKGRGTFNADFYIDRYKFKDIDCLIEDLRVTYVYKKNDIKVYFNSIAYYREENNVIIDQTTYFNKWDYFTLSNDQPVMKTIEMMNKSIKSRKRSLLNRIFSFFSVE